MRHLVPVLLLLTGAPVPAGGHGAHAGGG
ncbi:MAG: hypothetical protein UY90_C0080G0008, partial [Candidatus Peregrinibacteria bacterium GW2011_GWA2_54_9]